MGGRRRNLIILLFVVGMIAACAAVIATKPTRLGLDLRGGVELVYQGRPTPAQPEVTGEAIDRSIEIIRERIDKLGVAEPEVARLGTDQISVGLPDVTNAQRAIDQVGTTAQLYFYDWEPNVVTAPGRSGGEPGSGPETPFDDLYEAVQVASKRPPSCDGCTIGPRFYLFGRGEDHRLIAGPETNKRDLFVSPTGEKRTEKGEIIEVPQGTLVLSSTNEADPACRTDDCYWVIEDKPSLSGDDITDPRQEFDPTTNAPNVTFGFTDEGRDAFQDVTRRIAQRGQAKAIGPVSATQASALSGHFAVVLDNEVVSRPIINFVENPDGIDGRTGAQISGDFQIQEAQDLATFLQIGALPINLKLISQSEVSATLGQQALDQGLRAGIIGLLLVILFLIAYYHFLGVVATLGLVVYAIFFFALVKLIPITMTLPGIAGLILTIGVAADSNIVIFERIKEELRAGRTRTTAIAVGYRRGIATIIDANVITLLTAFILFVLATAGVKGFAFTLGIGTIVSLFTAVVFTQAFLGIFGRGRFLGSTSFGAGEERVRWHFDFVGMSRWFFSFSGIILLIGAFSLAGNQLNFGIDFESGTRLKFAPEKTVDVEQVRSVLQTQGLGDAEIQEVSDDAFGDGFQIQTGELQPGGVGEVRAAIQSEVGIQPGSFENTSVGPTFGEQVARSAAYAIIFSLLLISAYVGFRFEGKYAVPVLIAVAHDILITAGVYSLAGQEVSSATIAAFLTILGYSLYDTVIVFDRIRENVPRMPRAAFSQVVNRSMSEVLTRSLITGLSSVFLVGMLLVFGGQTLKDFAFAMMIGIASGTYSSIFIAAPVLTAWKEREPVYAARRTRIEHALGYVPPFADEMEVARLREDELGGDHEEPPVAADEVVSAPVEPEPEETEIQSADGAEAEAVPPEPAVAKAGPSKSERKRRQRQRRRKHGRNR
jgi:SecD/SecF fusion protein